MTSLVSIASALGDAEVFTDGDWVESKDQDPDGDVRLVQLADIGDGYWIDKSSRFLTSAKAQELKCTYLKPGDLLVARMPDPIGRCCIFPGDSMPCVTVVDVCVIRPNNQTVDTCYLMQAINSPVGRWGIARHVSGATRQRISRKNLGKVVIPLPPLDEQKRIAAILDAADALRAKRRESLDQLDALVQSTFLDMFGDPVENPMGWSVHQLQEIASKITDGEHQNPQFVDGGMPMVMARNVATDGINLKDVKYVRPLDGQKFRIKCGPVTGDLLIVSRGATIGRSCVVDNEVPFCLMGSVILVKLDQEAVDPLFFRSFLRHPAICTSLSRTSGSSAQQAIYLKDVRHLKCVLPPFSLQNQFGRIVKSIERQKARLQDHLDELDDLFAGLQQRAFAGEL